MKVYICDSCGAEIKEKKPEECPVCRRTKFTETEKEVNEKQDEHANKKYAEAIEILEKYEEGTPPRKMHDHTCVCGGKHKH